MDCVLPKPIEKGGLQLGSVHDNQLVAVPVFELIEQGVAQKTVPPGAKLEPVHGAAGHIVDSQ